MHKVVVDLLVEGDALAGTQFRSIKTSPSMADEKVRDADLGIIALQESML